MKKLGIKLKFIDFTSTAFKKRYSSKYKKNQLILDRKIFNFKIFKFECYVIIYILKCHDLLQYFKLFHICDNFLKVQCFLIDQSTHKIENTGRWCHLLKYVLWTNGYVCLKF